MNVLLTLDFPPARGGIQRYLHDIARFRYGRGDLVLVGGSGRRGRRVKVIEGGATVVYHGSRPAGRSKTRALVRLAAAYLRVWLINRGELKVECGNVYAGFVAWLLRPFTRQSYAVYTYGTELVALRGRRLTGRVLMRVLRGAEHLYALGRYTENLLRELGLRNRVEIVVPKIEQPPQAPERPARPAGATVRLLAVGRLVPHKGHALLLEAMSRLGAKHDVHCTIVGDGPYYEEIERRSRAPGLTGRVTLRREASDGELEQEYRRADVFIHPSRETAEGVEGFGIVLLEAMAHAVPIVAARTGGIPEVLAAGRCGVLIPPDDPGALAEAVERILSDPAATRRMALRAHRYLNEHYVWR